MEYKDYYKILGIERNADADAIKQSYRRLARKFHPDVSKEPNAEEQFKNVQEAYEVLKDKEKRAAYDEFADKKADLVVSGRWFVVPLFIRVMRGQKFRSQRSVVQKAAKEARIVTWDFMIHSPFGIRASLFS